MVNTLSRLTLVAGLALAPLAVANPLAAQDETQSSPFSATEEEQIRAIVRDYLVDNPEVLVEALQVYQERQRIAQQERQKEALTALRDTLENDADSPVIGNPDGDVVLIEFFDYNCPYCKRVANNVRELVEDDGNVRLVMKELPILGPASRYAALAALAAVKQGKYDDFHFALMNLDGPIDNLTVLRVAQELDIDIEQLQKDMRDPALNTALRRTYQAAQSLQIDGTPAFILGDQILPGAVNPEALKQLIAQQRANSS